MATAVRCSMCTNELGATHCLGCDQYYCVNDFQIHRQGMVNEMEKIVEERDHLQDEINNEAQPNHYFEQIDCWQKSTIEKVNQVAVQARQQVIELLKTRRVKISTEFESFSKNLANVKELGNYVEHDLKRLKQMINQLKHDLIELTQPTTIVLRTEQTDRIIWESLIYVEDQQAAVKNKLQKWLICHGRPCPICGRCSDWYVDNLGQRLKRRDGATCRHPGGPVCYSIYGPHYAICNCKLTE